MTVSVGQALLTLTVRQVLAGRRWILVLLLTALPVVMAGQLGNPAATEGESVTIVAGALTLLMLTVVVPMTSLILASAALGTEVEDGTVTYLLTKPIPRWTIVLAKLAVISSLGMAIAVTSTLTSGVIILHGLDSAHLIIGLAVGAALGSVLYGAIFLALCLITRRGMLIGLVYLVVWEGALAGYFSGTRVLSVRQYMLSIADRIATVEPSVLLAQLPVGTAYTMSAVVVVGATILAIHRLRTFQVGKVG